MKTNFKPPISQKVSPISTKYHTTISKPLYYSPKEKYSDPSIIALKKVEPTDFSSYYSQTPQQISNSDKYLKKSGSNDHIKTNYFDFKQPFPLNNALIINEKEKEKDVSLLSTLRALRKDTKVIKSDGDIHHYNHTSSNSPIRNMNPSIFLETLNKDMINNPSVVGIEPKGNKSNLSCQSTILDKCLPKFLRTLNIPQNYTYNSNLQNYKAKNFANYNGDSSYKKQEISYKSQYNGTCEIVKKPELVESFVNVISNDSDVKIKQIKNIEFSANPFVNNPTIFIKPLQSFPSVAKNWRIEDFDLGKCLGKGRFGKVFLAREKKTRSLFALKCILKKGMLNHYAFDQMIREIKIHSFLQHVNVIQIYGCFEDSLKVYLILELALQGNLFNELHKQVKIKKCISFIIIKKFYSAK